MGRNRWLGLMSLAIIAVAVGSGVGATRLTYSDRYLSDMMEQSGELRLRLLKKRRTPTVDRQLAVIEENRRWVVKVRRFGYDPGVFEPLNDTP